VLVTRRLPETVEARLRRDYNARFNENDHLYSREEMLAKSEGTDALLITMEDQMDANLVSIAAVREDDSHFFGRL
jgi:hypothetical protein